MVWDYKDIQGRGSGLRTRDRNTCVIQRGVGVGRSERIRQRFTKLDRSIVDKV